MNFRKINLQFYGLLVFSLFIPVLFLFLFSNHLRNRERIEQGYNERLSAEYQIIMGVYSDLSELIYKTQIDTPEVKKLFAEGVHSRNEEEKDAYRKELYKNLTGIYQMILNYDFRQLHFHESDNHSYLRFHSPLKYGDDLTGIRYSVEYVNRENKPISGFEEGRIFNGYRFVYPLNMEGEHLGSVEVSVSMKTVVDQLQQRFKQTSQFIILKTQVEKKVFDSEFSNYSPWSIDNDYLLDKAISTECVLDNRVSDADKNKILTALTLHQGTPDPFSVPIELEEKHVLVSFFPISNFYQEQVAYLFTFFEGDDLRNLDLSFYFVSTLLLILFLLIVAFSFYYRSSRKKIEMLATIDSLTQAYVRREIMNQMKKMLESYRRYKTVFSVIMIDIDHFKKVNDTYGHTTGDTVLVGVSRIILENLRNTDSLGRYGGEEFIVLLPDTSKENAATVAEKLREKVSLCNFPKAGQVTVSLGVSEIQMYMASCEELTADADKKLYRAKDEGRNRVIS